MKVNETAPKSKWIQFIALLFGSFIAIEAMVFQAPALPSIALFFEVPTQLAGFIVLAFYIMSASFYPITGRLSDQYGRKLVLLIGMAIFSLSEFAAALSPTFSFLLIARAIQGVGVACIFPNVIAYIGVLFPKEKRGNASGIFNFAQAIGSMSGAAIAGFLISIYGWPIIYWVGGGLAFIGFFVIFFFVEESKGEAKAALDVPGIILIFIATSCLLSVTTLVEFVGIDSPLTLGVTIAGIVAAGFLWMVENRTEKPIIELGLLKNRLYGLVALLYLFNVAAMQLYIYSMNFFLTLRPGGIVTETGFFFMFIYGSAAIGGLIVGKLSDKFNDKLVLIVTLLIPTTALLINAQIEAGTSFSKVAVIAAFFGIGSAIPVLIKLALVVVPDEKYGAGSGLLAFIRDFGTPLGSVTGIVLYSSFSQSYTQESLIDQAEDAGISADLMGAVEQAGESSELVTDSPLAHELMALGVEFEDIMDKATGIGATEAINSLSYVSVVFFVIIIVVSMFLPNKIGVKKDNVKDEEIFIAEK